MLEALCNLKSRWHPPRIPDHAHNGCGHDPANGPQNRNCFFSLTLPSGKAIKSVERACHRTVLTLPSVPSVCGVASRRSRRVSDRREGQRTGNETLKKSLKSPTECLGQINRRRASPEQSFPPTFLPRGPNTKEPSQRDRTHPSATQYKPALVFPPPRKSPDPAQ